MEENEEMLPDIWPEAPGSRSHGLTLHRWEMHMVDTLGIEED